jgi:hypothetical protein
MDTATAPMLLDRYGRCTHYPRIFGLPGLHDSSLSTHATEPASLARDHLKHAGGSCLNGSLKAAAAKGWAPRF